MSGKYIARSRVFHILTNMGSSTVFFIELIPINLKPYKNHQPPRLKNAHSYHVAILVESQID